MHGLGGGQWVRAPRAPPPPPPHEHEGVSCSLQFPLCACARPTRLSGLCVPKQTCVSASYVRNRTHVIQDW